MHIQAFGIVPPILTLSIKEIPLSMPAKEVTLDYLRRFVHSLSTEKLKKFSRFVTGLSVCSSRNITVTLGRFSEEAHHSYMCCDPPSG